MPSSFPTRLLSSALLLTAVALTGSTAARAAPGVTRVDLPDSHFTVERRQEVSRGQGDASDRARVAQPPPPVHPVKVVPPSPENRIMMVLEEEVLRRHTEILDAVVEADRQMKIKTVVTSSYRSNSKAHKRGALDFSSKELGFILGGVRASKVSKLLGPEYLVINEVVVDQHGKLEHWHYRDGRLLNVKEFHWPGAGLASATHMHVQPERPLPPRNAAAAPTPKQEVPFYLRGEVKLQFLDTSIPPDQQPGGVQEFPPF